MNLSHNFSLEELTSSQKAKDRGIPNTPTEEALRCLKELANDLLQPLRDRIGKAFKITSGYRSPALNSAVGGSKTSQHNKGQAVDFTVKDMSPLEVCRFIATSGLEFDQLIFEQTWVHLSYNKGNNRNQILTATFDSKGKATYSEGLPK